MIGIVGGCISYSMTNYTLPLQLSSAFFHGLWTWFIAFCLADVFNLLQDNEEENGRQIEVTRKLEEILPAFYVGLHTLIGIYRIISAIFQIYRRFLHFYRRFFIISAVRHRISTYRHSSTIKTLNIPYPQAIYCRTLRLKR